MKKWVKFVMSLLVFFLFVSIMSLEAKAEVNRDLDLEIYDFTGRDPKTGRSTEIAFTVSNDTKEAKNNISLKLWYLYGDELYPIEEDYYIYKNGDRPRYPFKDINNITIESHDRLWFSFDWTYPKNWDNSKCRLLFEATDGVNTWYDSYPNFYGDIISYRKGDYTVSNVRIEDSAKNNISFGDETEKTISVKFDVTVQNGWKPNAVQFGWKSEKSRTHYIRSGEVCEIVEIKDENTMTCAADIKVNKWMRNEFYYLNDIKVEFEKQYKYDMNHDNEINEEDLEWGAISYSRDSAGNLKMESLNYQIGEDESLLRKKIEPAMLYAGEADFRILNATSDKSEPIITSVEFLEDPNLIDGDDVDEMEDYPSTVKVLYDEQGAGLKSIRYWWYDTETGNYRPSNCAEWFTEQIGSVTGCGCIEMDSVYCPWRTGSDECYIGILVIEDFAGNICVYETEPYLKKDKLICRLEKYDEESDSYQEVIHEIDNITFYHYNEYGHLYGLEAPEEKYQADAVKKKNGKGYQYCLVCGEKGSSSLKTIYYPKYYSVDNGVYTGDAVGCGTVEIKDYKKKIIHPSFYQVEPIDDATSVGIHKVKIIFNGNYKGEVTKSYVIVPAAVSEVSAEVSGGHNDVKVSWEPAEGASGYYVSWGRVYTNKDGEQYVKEWCSKKSTSKTYYTAKELTSDKLYRFRVVPYYKRNDTKYYETSQYQYAECKTHKNMKAPESVTATLNGVYNEICLKWKSCKYADGYNIYYKLGTQEYQLLTCTGDVETKEAINLEDGGKYTFKVVPYYMENEELIEGSYGKTKTIYILKATDAPKVTKSSSKVKVSWNNISGESGYEISRSEDPAVEGKIYDYKTTSGKSKIISASKGVTYYYKVRAYKTVNSKKIYGPWSEITEYTR